jgi:hypothetical protein
MLRFRYSNAYDAGTTMRAFLLIALGTPLLAQQPAHPTDRLVRARNILVDRAKHLPDYTCIQTVDRRYFKRLPRKVTALDGDVVRTYQPIHSCDQIRSLSRHDLVLQSTDRLRLDIKVSQGFEIGSWPDSQFSARSIFELISGGPYGTGMLGALISDIFVNGGATYRYVGEETATGTQLSAFTYHVPLGSSHYQVKSGSNWVAMEFAGAFWLDSTTLDLKRLSVQATELPRQIGACQAETTVDYQKVHVGTGEFLLPRQSSLRLVMEDESETQSTAVYSGCREYVGKSTIRFDQAPAAGETKSAEVPATPLPEGLPLSLTLTSPIDTNTAAAGEIVTAKVRKPVRAPQSKIVLVPAGAVVQGRIIQMQHWLNKPRHFTISILLERLEVGGLSRPLYAKIDTYSDLFGSTTIARTPVGLSPLAAAFLFMTNKNRYRVPAGYKSNWVTVDPPLATEKKK